MRWNFVFALLLSVAGCCSNRSMEVMVPPWVRLDTTRPIYDQRTPDWPQQELRPVQPPILIPCPERVRRLPPVV